MKMAIDFIFSGATVTHQNKWCESALSYACYQGHDEVTDPISHLDLDIVILT